MEVIRAMTSCLLGSCALSWSHWTSRKYEQKVCLIDSFWLSWKRSNDNRLKSMGILIKSSHSLYTLASCWSGTPLFIVFFSAVSWMERTWIVNVIMLGGWIFSFLKLWIHLSGTNVLQLPRKLTTRSPSHHELLN